MPEIITSENWQKEYARKLKVAFYAGFNSLLPEYWNVLYTSSWIEGQLRLKNIDIKTKLLFLML